MGPGDRPRSPPTTVYAGLEGGGVFRSTTGGATWSSFNSGFPNPLTTNVRALLTSSAGTTVYAGTDAGLYKSTGGAWQPLAQGAEADPDNPKKLNQSVQSLLELPGGVMLAGVFSGGVYKSPDGGATWQPPAPDNGMPKSETVYGLTSNVPGVVYATAGSGVYVSIDAGSKLDAHERRHPEHRLADHDVGVPAATADPLHLDRLQRHLPLAQRRRHLGADQRRARGGARARLPDLPGRCRAPTSTRRPRTGSGRRSRRNSFIAPAPRWRAVTQEGLIEPGASNVIMWSLTAPVIPARARPA